MPIYETDLLTGPDMEGEIGYQLYNGLDCGVTYEVWEALRSLTNKDPITYDFERALQAPALEMMLRGFRIDQSARVEGIHFLKKEIDFLDKILQRYAFAVWAKPLNPRSPKQLIDFFYGALKLPEQWTSMKGQRKLSTNRESLEKLELYFYARPIIATILAIRDSGKRLSVLETDIDSDGRMRTSYNIAGTETGRWSSSANSTGGGTNLQNIQPSLRKIFVADPGYKLVGIDLEQAESREVAWLCGTLFSDWSYLDACTGGDLHTTTCKLIWDQLPWTGDGKKDKELAEQPFYRHYSYRDMSKRGGHGSNYYGTPFTMARHLKVPTKFMEDFQIRYFAAFPGIPRWHKYVAKELQTKQKLTSAFGRERHFFGRPNDETTLREAIAYCPQSATGDRMNLGLWKIWHHMKEVELLAQVHDAVYFQFKEGLDEKAIIEKALSLIEISTTDPASGRSYMVPGEAKSGWNWGNYHPDTNPNGLKKFKNLDERKRLSALERLF